MRIAIFLSIVVLAVSGCAGSGVRMYSVPSQNISSIRSQSSQVSGQSLAFKAPASEKQHVKECGSEPKKSKPNRKKKSGKNKSILNDAIGVSYKLAKDAIRYIGPKLPKIPGF
jgi:hypothetical protein